MSVAVAQRLPRIGTARVSGTEGLLRHNVTFGMAAFIGLHVLVGPVFYNIRQFAVLHAFVVMAIVFWWAISRDRPLEQLAYAGAYLTGAEALWRVTRVSGYVVIWEFSKYMLVAVFVIGLIVRKRFTIRNQLLPILYFALLLPSALIPLMESSFSVAREDISFNLSCPLALAISVLFFAQLDRDRLDTRKLLLAMIGPALSLAAITLHQTIVSEVDFSQHQSLKATSGYFGANQVSATLALAALGALLVMLEEQASKGLRVLMFAVMMFLLIQSALTFSRGGLYTFSGGAIVVFLCLVTDAQKRLRLLLFGIVILALANYVVVPALDRFTDGALLTRFADTGLTGRDDLAESDLSLWREHPWLGVGPGQSMYHRDVSIVGAVGHTEFTRLLAEHGAFGLGSLIVLGIMGLRAARRRTAPADKALALAGLAWSVLFMATTGMRMVAPAFMVGVAASGSNEPPVRSRGPYFRQFRRPSATVN